MNLVLVKKAYNTQYVHFMIIKRFNESKKIEEVLNQYKILHLDQSAISRSTLSNFLSNYRFIVNGTRSVELPNELLPELNREYYDCLFINYATCQYDFCILLRRIKKLYPKIISIIYNFSHSQFEKKHLLKAGLNALLPTNFAIEELLLSLPDMSPDSVYINYLVTEELILNINRNIVGSIDELTPKQILFLRSACSGLSHREIGEKYFNSKQRVDNVFHEIRIKIGCETQIDFLRFALMHKIIDWKASAFEIS